MAEEKRDSWDLEVEIASVCRFVFDEDVTRKEAIELAVSGDYADIIDEYDFIITKVIDAS